MAIGDVDVVYRDGKWRIEFHGQYDRQADAWVAAQDVARRLGRESFLRSLSGRWRLRNTFPRARDPRRSRG
jgi:hypothetical protein